MSDDCVFCAICAGDLPACKVYEDDDTLALMDINPITNGHVLVIPKAHYRDVAETPVAVLERLIAVVKRIAVAQQAGMHADGVNVTQANGEVAGQVIPHIHFHVIPRLKDDTHSWTSPLKGYENEDDMASVCAVIRREMTG